MEAKHTPGPWRATLGRSQMSDPGTTIYHLGQWGVYSDADSHGDPEADARLIAAAPELLAAVEQTYAELADISNEWPGRGTAKGQAKLVALRDVIAKATGRDAQEVQDAYSVGPKATQ